MIMITKYEIPEKDFDNWFDLYNKMDNMDYNGIQAILMDLMK